MRIGRLDGVTSSSMVGVIVIVLLSIGEGRFRVIVKLNELVLVYSCSCDFFASVKD